MTGTIWIDKHAPADGKSHLVHDQSARVPLGSATGGLFRSEAIQGQHISPFGGIVLDHPIADTLVAAVSTLFVLGLVGVVALCSYTRRVTIHGQLLPPTGVTTVTAPQFGNIVSMDVREGESIGKGALLYVLSSDRRTSTVGLTQGMITREDQQRTESLRRSMNVVAQLSRQTLAELQEKLHECEDEELTIQNSKTVQEEQVGMANSDFEKYSNLREDDLVSDDQVNQKRVALLTDRKQLLALNRDWQTVHQQCADLRSQLAQEPFKRANDLAELHRELDQVDQDLANSEARRRVAIVAPTSGIATDVVARIGDSVDAGGALVSIVPANQALEAQLYAPRSAIGFVRPGERVALRYPAYPYEKYGHYWGTILSVSRFPVPIGEFMPDAAVRSQATSSGDAVYVIVVALDTNAIHAFGQAWPLKAGMTVDADIMEDSRQLYQWMMEPIYTITGKFR